VLFAALLLVAGLIAPTSASAAARTFTNSYAQTLHGDIAAIGNSNSSCKSTWTACTPGALGNGNSNMGGGTLIDVDTDATTTNSSSSTLNLPAGAVVKSARLIWGTAGDGTNNNGEATVKFDTPASAGYAYTSVTATAANCGTGTSGNTRGIGCSADVTAQVLAAGSGAYTVANIEQRALTTTTIPDHWSGWGLYVAYELPTEPLRRLVMADGFQTVASGAPTTITANGFVAPASGSVTAQLTYMVGEGDSDIKGDYATFGTKNLDTAATPNLMDSEIRGLTYQGTRTPSNLNNYGFDFHQDEINGAIPNAATSANFTFNSTQDVYYPYALGIAIDLGEPALVLTKTLTDVNGGVVEPGDVIEYQIVAQNNGNDGAAAVTMTDPIPAGTTYVPGSMQVTAGANAGIKTDAAGDDQANFGGNQVTMRLGAGATATAGGVLAAGGGTSTVKFRVKIDANVDEGVPLVNTASGSYIGQTSLLAYADPSSVAATPVRRADMVVAQTLSPNMTAGQAGTVTLTASNIGGAQTYAQPVTVKATIPAGVTFGGVTSAPGWTCTVALPTVTCTRTDALLATSSFPDIVLAVTPSQTIPSATFGAQVSGGNEVRTNNDTDSDSVTFLRSADLKLTKAVDKTAAKVGDTLTYTLTATNDGPTNTTGVSVSDPLPAGLQPLTATSTAGTCSTAGQTVTCAIGALASGATAQVTITAKVLPTAVASSLVNAATITGADPDPDSPDNSDQTTTTIGQAADLHLTKSVSPTVVNPGASATWTINLSNVGPGTASGVSIADTLPAGAVVQSITPSAGTTCGTGSPFTCTVGSLASGASASVVVVVKPALSAAGTTITNSATVNASTWDPNTADNTATSALTVNPAADLRVVKTVDKGTANVDDLLTWTVALTNDGPSPASGATITDTAPSGVAIQSVTPPTGVTCTSAGQTISCSVVGVLPSGTTKTVTIVGKVARASAGSPQSNSATVASSTFDPDASNNLSTVTTNVNTAADLTVTKTADKTAANVGDTINWTVTATNLGASTATNVVVTDVLPAGVTLLTRTTTAGTCAVAGAQVVCTIPSLPTGSPVTINLSASVDRAAAETPLQNVAQITGTEFDPDTANNSTNVTTTVGPATDLQLTKSVSKTTAAVGDALTYTLTATNGGPSTATGVQLTDALPIGFQPSGTPTITGGSCSITSGTLTCTLASLASGGARTITIPGTVTAAAAGTSMANTATITGDQYDQDPTNNTTPAVTTTVAGDAELALTKTVDKNAANVGDTLTYTIKVKNTGPQAATGTVVSDPLPAGLTRLGATTSQGTCAAGSPVVCSLGSVAVGATATVTITARVDLAAANSTVTNTATTTSTQDDTNPADNTGSASTTIAPAADLKVVKTVDKGTADVGDTITWTVTASNNGPQGATGVTVTDAIPSGVLLLPITPPAGVTCTTAASTVSCAIAGTLASGASKVITLSGTVKRAAAETPQQNTATIGGSQLDPDTSNNLSTVTTNVNKAADLRVAKSVDQTSANVGDTLTWTLSVTNDGPSVASGVTLIDDLPAGTTLVSATIPAGTCSVTSTQVICPVGTLASGQTATATIKSKVERANAESPVNNTGRATGGELDPDPSNNIATAASTIGPSTDLRVSKSVDQSSANVGDTLTYTLTVTNDGPSAATGVTLTDVLPASLTRTGTVTASQGSCNPTGQTLSCTVGAIPYGSSATIVVRAIVQSAAAGTTITNSATVAGGQSDPIPGNNASAPATTAIAAAADVQITTTVDRSTANVGDPLVYTFVAKNNGPSTATGTQITATLPSGVSLTAHTVPAGFTCTGATVNPVVCTGSLASGASVSFTATATVLLAAANSTQTAGGAVTATPLDPVPANNASSIGTTINPAADLKITKTVDKTSANIGDTLTYALKADNLGPTGATGVKITDTLPSTLQIVGTPISTQGTCAVAGQTVTCTVGSLANGASATATIVAKLLPAAAASSVANTGTVSGNEFDPTPGNDASTPTTTTVSSAADLLVTQSVDQPTINVGDTVNYTITVKNNGPQTATAVSLTDDLPTGATLISATPSQGSCGTGDPFACSISTLASGASATIVVKVKIVGAAESTFPNVASATATQFDPNLSNNAATAATSTNPASDLTITKTADKTMADVGDTITWTITATNTGPSSATGVVVTDTAPAGVTLLPVTNPASTTCTTAGQTVSCARTGSIPSGGTLVITLKGTVKLASAGSPLSNSATVAGNQFDPDTSNNLSAVTTNVNAAADLRVSKNVDQATANVGDTLTWTVVATNDGPSTATSVVITDDLPTGVTLTGNTPSAGTTCTVSGTQLICTAASLASGASITVTLTGTVKTSAAESPVDNTARVTSATLDPDPADNLSTASTTIGPAADLTLAKAVDKTNANVGDTVTYTLTATNNGPSSATGASVVDTLPTTLQLVGTPTASQGACSVTGQTVTCSLGTLANGASATATIKAIVKPSASSTTVGNTASISGTRLDPDPSNNATPSITTAVGAAADLVVTHSVDQTTLNLGDTATFTIAVKNTGPSTATSVSLSDALPAGTTLLSATTSQGTCINGNPVTCAIGTLASGANATITVKLRLDTGASATFTSTAKATATEYEPTPADNTASAATSTGPSADLSLTKTADKGTADVGETITWTLTANNAGPSPATGVTVTDTIPAGITGVTASGDAGVTCTVAAPTVSCAIAGPWSTGSHVITLKGTLARSTAGSPLSNQASIAGAEFDPAPADNLSTATTNVSDAADLKVAKTADKTNAGVGDTITWTVAATNDGPSAATGVTITDDFPAGVTFVSASTAAGPCPLVGTQVSCSVGALASGQTVTATITGTVDVAAAETPVVNAARVTSTTFDPDTANNLSSVSTAVGKSIDLSTSAVVSKTNANVGDELLYTFTIGNAGPSTATGATFTHTLPANVTFVTSTTSQGGCSVAAGVLSCALGAIPSGGSATVTAKVTVDQAAAGTTINARGAVSGAEPDRNAANDQSPIVSTAVAQAADLAVATTVDQATSSVGDTVTYLVSVTNQGPSTATGVQLTNQLPAGATVVSVTPSQGTCDSADPRSCALGTLAPNASATLTVVVRATAANAGALITDSASATADQFDPVTTNNASQASSAVGVAADLSIVKTADKSSAEVGDTITWTLVAKNNGPKDATGVTVSDVIPPGVTISSATSTAGSCTLGAPVVCAIGNLANGATATITVVGKVDRAAAGSPLSGQATIAGAELDPVPANNTSAAIVNVGPAADLRVTKLVDKTAPAIGDPVTWTIQVFNDGPQTATSVQVTDVVPAGAPVTSASVTGGGTCTRTGQSVTCTVPTLASGASATVTIRATVASNAGGATIDNTATASSAVRDPDPSNNTASVHAVAGDAADLGVTIAPNRPTATVGEAITWTAVVGNAGPKTATGVVTTLTIPAGLTGVTATVPGGTCTIAGQTATCTLPDLASGASNAIELTGTAGRTTAETSLVAKAVVAGTLPDPLLTNNTATAATVPIPASVDLVVTKTIDKPAASAGENVTITTTVLNRGPSTASGVVLTDTIPEGVDFVSVTPSQGNCVVEGRQITCRLDELPDGASATIQLVVTIRVEGADQQLLNAGSASSDQPDADGSNNAAQVVANGAPAGVKPGPAPATPSIELKKTVDKASAVAGSQVVFTLSATNHGSGAATGVRITDPLPAGLEYVSTKASAGLTCSRKALTITCLASTLAPGQTVTAKITTTIATSGVPIDNVATLTAAGLADTTAKGQRASASVTGSGAPYVVAGIHPLEAYTRPGKTVRIAVKVTNVGQAEAKDVVACFTLPSGVVLTKKPAGLVQHGAKFCLTQSRLAKGKNKRVVLTARVVGGAGTSRPKLTGKSTNSRVKVETYPLVVKGRLPTRAAGVTG
jgi:uncharacterized repeat protein (TIGR01451 family)